VVVPIRGTDKLFPVRRVYCVGRNYADHAIEMGGDPNAEPPFFFQKNPENLLHEQDFPYPPLSQDVHHEIELAVMLRDGGDNIAVNDALDMVYGYAVAIDFTRRDLQADAKAKGQPWIKGKAFEHSAPISEVVPAHQIGHPSEGRIWLAQDGQVKQDGNLNQMTWKVPQVISELSKYFTLAAGDIILTGTPSGVGPVNKGNQITCGIEGVADMSLSVV